MKKDMEHKSLSKSVLQSFSALGFALLSTMSVATGAVVVGKSSVDPVPGLYDQYNLDSSGITIGIGDNYSNHAGPPGQVFTTPAGSSFLLDTISIKGGGDMGGGGSLFSAVWSLRVSAVSGSTLTPVLTDLNIQTIALNPSSTDWIIFSFSGVDQITLDANTAYAFEVYVKPDPGFGPATYYLFAGSATDVYAGGAAFTNAGGSDVFDSNTMNTPLGYDRTFSVGLTAVPEPSVVVLLGVSALAFVLMRRKLSII